MGEKLFWSYSRRAEGVGAPGQLYLSHGLAQVGHGRRRRPCEELHSGLSSGLFLFLSQGALPQSVPPVGSGSESVKGQKPLESSVFPE